MAATSQIVHGRTWDDYAVPAILGTIRQVARTGDYAADERGGTISGWPQIRAVMVRLDRTISCSGSSIHSPDGDGPVKPGHDDCSHLKTALTAIRSRFYRIRNSRRFITLGCRERRCGRNETIYRRGAIKTAYA
jgi:hypothetical protein